MTHNPARRASSAASASAVTATAVTYDAPAKVNLNLLVVGRRDDGLHLIDSLAIFAALSDKITLAPAVHDALSCSGEFAGNLNSMAGDNIISRALAQYRRATGWTQPLAISLEKNIPVAAGLGGGSADAAAVLHGVNRLAGSPLNDADLARLGLGLGADIPLCLKAHIGNDSGTNLGQNAGTNTAWHMRGIGADLTPLTLPPPWRMGDAVIPNGGGGGDGCGLVLLNIGVAVSTAGVFAAWGERGVPFAAPPIYPDALDVPALEHALSLGNSLTEAAIASTPPLAEGAGLIRRLAALGHARHHGMSGSGGTFFAIFDSIQAARDAALKANPPCWYWAGGLFRG